MLILLPPSEGKHAADHGEPFSLDSLSFPGLGPERGHVLAALAEASSGEDAHAVLGVGESLAHEIARNRRLTELPAAPAHTVYTGVLYEALGYSGLTAPQRRKADASIVVVSALWGAVGFADRIPAYRLSMSVKLPGIGGLPAWWKPRLTPVLDERSGDGLVVDCRSSSYAAAYAPPPARTVAVSVVQERGGARKVVSHFAKHTRGELARHLLTRPGRRPGTPHAVLTAAREKWRAELVPATARKPHQLVVVLPEDHSFSV
ncbi:YaaA family protein [Zafaria sp. Z1313]|uniref:YaaA family protein n=1 Tax=unclassified Zafaria TaxID=2828765 RepID=UPI002E75CF90|nr:peroxide stress protein YaaA [Zafaria sp. J156]MEE1620664.1 peroxide stress protein YaaA [Zafaria sp. J156]